MTSKFIGGILLIVGTSIGAGMLALPVTTASGGFLGALALLILCWLIMTFGAFLILEVNLWLAPNSNLVSMAKKTLGRPGEIVAWVTYLLLLYSLLAAYISGGADIFNGLLSHYVNYKIAPRWDAVLFLLIFGFIVYHGIKPIDYVNRVLMTIKLVTLAFLILLIFPHVHTHNLVSFDLPKLIPAVTVTVVSFGFATIIPSLRGYFGDDIKKLRRAILIGSLIPLICYILWVGAILAEIPLQGNHGMLAILKSPQPTTSLVQSLNLYLQNSWVTTAAHLFTSICVATSFLGVSLCLWDFLADGLRIPKTSSGKLINAVATFLPPLIIVLFYPSAFIICLSYGGIFCVILLVMLPAFMAWRGRYKYLIAGKYQVSGGKSALALATCAAVLIVVQDLMLSWHLI
jgi:tyrosine-specific transport protein